jgi:hypothetical protein
LTRHRPSTPLTLQACGNLANGFTVHEIAVANQPYNPTMSLAELE